MKHIQLPHATPGVANTTDAQEASDEAIGARAGTGVALLVGTSPPSRHAR